MESCEYKIVLIREISPGKETENTFNELGAEGWEAYERCGNYVFFRRYIVEKQKHPLDITGYEDNMPALVEKIGNLRYDSLAAFFRLLKDKMERDARDDLVKRKRVLLSNELMNCSVGLGKCIDAAEAAWKISKPYMKDETEKNNPS